MRDASTKRFWLILLALVVLSAAYAQWRGIYPRYLDYTESRMRLEQLHQEAAEARAEDSRLTQRVMDLGDNRVEQEASIRHGKNLVRPGETVYRIEIEP